MLLRRESPGDVDAIARLTDDAFHGVPHSDGSESAIVADLRMSGALTLSLVAEDAGRLVGHAAFSPVRIDGADLGWFGLGPVSVAPPHRRRGIGSALIRRGLDDLTEAGARGFVVLGDPAYYGRLGFGHDPGLTYGDFGAYFQVLSVDGDAPRGEVTYAAAFG